VGSVTRSGGGGLSLGVWCLSGAEADGCDIPSVGFGPAPILPLFLGGGCAS